MQKLIDGVHRFRSEEFGRYYELFQKLSTEGQKPHTLFITCADSRVLAELITQSQPGDLFVVKNIGNIIPTYTAEGTENSTAAAIEFAVTELAVNDIVVCGHSQCGGMRALLTEGFLDNDEPTAMPNLRAWLRIAAPVRETIARDYGHITDPQALNTAAGEENVLFALESLHTYPAVRERLADGSLHLHGWFFHIDRAELYAYDPNQKQFLPLVAPQPANKLDAGS